MAFNTRKLAENGNINLFALEGEGNYILMFNFTNISFVATLLKDSRGYKTYISPTYSDDQFADISEFMRNEFNKIYDTLPKYVTCLSKDAPAHEKVVTSYVTGKCNKCDPKITNPILVKMGYDISKLTAGLCVSARTRNYQPLIDSDKEAKQLYEENKDFVENVLQASIKDFSNDSGIPLLFNTLKNGYLNGVLIIGPAGTGKSVLTQIIANELGAPYDTIQATGGTETDDIVGGFIPKSDGDGFEFLVNGLLKAYSKGYVFNINEINMSPARILSILNQFADGTQSYSAPNGVTYKKHPNFLLTLTMNPGYTDTEILNAALKNRFRVLVLDRLSKAEYKARVHNYTRRVHNVTLNPALFDKLYDYSNKIMTLAQTFNETFEVSVRNAQDFVDMILTKSCNKEEFKAALNICFSNGLSCDNDNLEKLKTFQNSKEEIEFLESLYKEYNFKQVDVVNPDNSYEDSLISGDGEDNPKSRINKLSEEDSDTLNNIFSGLDFEDTDAESIYDTREDEDKDGE